MYCSIKQAVDIWDELRDAMDDNANYNGTEAEIYAYRLMPYYPNNGNYRAIDKIQAAQSLVGLIDMFCENQGGCKFLINDIDCHDWLKEYGTTFEHRVHVKYVKLN